LSAGTFLVGGIATLILATAFETLVLVPAGVVAGAGSLTHGIMLAGHVTLWGLISGSITLVGARMLAAGSPISRRARWLFIIGILAAAGLQFAVHEYGRARFDYFDPSAVGPTSLLPLVLVAMTTAWVGVLVSRARVAIVWAAFGLSSLSALAIFALNLPGIDDGIEAGSLPLAVAIALAGLVGMAYWAVALDMWRRPMPPLGVPG
jgi:hypothetical protein